MAKLGLHAMTVKLKKRDEDLAIYKQQISLTSRTNELESPIMNFDNVKIQNLQLEN